MSSSSGHPAPPTTSTARPICHATMRESTSSKAAHRSPTETDMTCIKNDPNYNELQPRAVVPYKAIYGVDEPATPPVLQKRRQRPPGPRSRHALRPGRAPRPSTAATPHPARAIAISTASTRSTPRRMAPRPTGAPRVPTLASTPTQTSTPCASLHGTQSSHVGRGPGDRQSGACADSTTTPANACASSARFRCARRTPAVSRSSIRTATRTPASLAKIPADTPFTFQTLDKDGLVLNMSQTWHQLRPGETAHRLRRLPRAFPDAAGLRSHLRIQARNTTIA